MRGYLILGSNERRAASLRLAVQQLAARFDVLACAPGRRTRAIGVANDYINAGVLIHSELEWAELTTQLHAIEDVAGRERGGARCRLDIDLVASELPDASIHVHKCADMQRDYVQAILDELGWPGTGSDMQQAPAVDR